VKVKNIKNVPGVAMGKAAPGVTKQVLIGPADGVPTFVMRRFTLKPGAATPCHKHNWEHEIFVVEGQGLAVSEEGKTRLRRGNVVFVPAGEMHQFRNVGARTFSMLCLVPVRGEK
jgi:quercetin dioxygenase-like cupin family protein